jgi:hypothetical protein
MDRSNDTHRDSPSSRIEEGYVKKGGINTSSKIKVRPGKPAPMKVAPDRATNEKSGSAKGKAAE